MFNNDTVFVLGAGASWHYGYPTGEGLIDAVISMAERFALYCRNRERSGQLVQAIPKYVLERMDTEKGIPGAKEGWRRVREECHLLIDRLRTVRPLVIDYFLGWNPSIQEIGKLMIAAAILECEAAYAHSKCNANRRLAMMQQPIPPSPEQWRRFDPAKYKDDWYRFIIHKLVSDCSTSKGLLRNKVRFITFNYDTSLEDHLLSALTSIDFIDDEDATQFMEGRVLHMYGAIRERRDEGASIDPNVPASLGSDFSQPLNFERDFVPRRDFLDLCLAASGGIRTIDPHDKSDEEATVRAHQWMKAAKIVYILGYGFDENNNERAGLRQYLGQGRLNKTVMFTNYNDLNIINKKASQLMLNRYDGFDGKTSVGNPENDGYAEKSVRNVYDALEMDFYALETQFSKTK